MSKNTKQVLGKGLGALLPSIEFSDKGFKIAEKDNNEGEGNFAFIDVTKIVYNPYQPRKDLDLQALEDLKNSIIENGVIQPITVRRSINGYEIISGERRLRATIAAGIEKIPAYILELDSDIRMLELALIENVQRENLNPIETAHGYHRLIEECNLTQEQVASKIGKDRSTITNFLRLLRLPEKIQESLRKKELSMGHARALLGLSDIENVLFVWQEVTEKNLSVRATEKLVKDIETGRFIPSHDNKKLQGISIRKKTDSALQLIIEDNENRLRHIFGTKVKIQAKSKESGSIELEFYSKDDFDRLLELFSAANRTE